MMKFSIIRPMVCDMPIQGLDNLNNLTLFHILKTSALGSKKEHTPIHRLNRIFLNLFASKGVVHHLDRTDRWNHRLNLPHYNLPHYNLPRYPRYQLEVVLGRTRCRHEQQAWILSQQPLLALALSLLQIATENGH